MTCGQRVHTPYGLESLAEIRHRIETGSPKARPIEYKGFAFRSRLEARYAYHLDERGIEWTYEPRVYGQAGRRYLPDFEILGGPYPTFIEIKPTLEEVPAAEVKMSVIWEELPDALLIVASGEDCCYFAAVAGGEWDTWQERWPSHV